jgi:hypothetical protein
MATVPDRHKHLDTAVEVAFHHVGRADDVQRLALTRSVRESVDA